MILIIFKNPTALQRAWRKLRLDSLGRGCVGVVHQLAYTAKERTEMHVDPRYFAIMGLAVTHLGTEVITHESVHAGYAYAKRVWERNLWVGAKHLDEENVCYPAGLIARGIVNVLYDNHLVERFQASEQKRTARVRRRLAGRKNAI
jgi:hypothetical protein